MATDAAIISALEDLASAYPEAKREKASLRLYHKYLSDIPDEWLKRAVDVHICTSSWYPHVAELRQQVARLARTKDFESLYEFTKVEIRDQFMALNDAFWHDDVLVEAEWLKLAAIADENDCPNQAENIRHRLATYQEMIKNRAADQEAPALTSSHPVEAG